LTVAGGAFAADSMRHERRDDGVATPLLALLDVRQMHLDERHVEDLERIVDRVAVMRPRSRVEDDAVDVAVGVVDPADVLALAVRLSAADGQRELLRPLVDLRLELVQAEAAVDLGVPPSEHVEVHAVQDEDLHRLTLTRAQAINRSSSRRTSSADRSSTRGPPSPRSTRLIASPVRFLSRRSARQARSGSTSTGRGSSARSTASVSRPESRSAARRPSATASPCGRSKSAAASSACAKVWPRFRNRRGPWSWGSRRQTAALYAAAPRTSSGRPASSCVFTSSAAPWRRSRSGSVSRSASSRRTSAGQWKAPTRFLPSGMSMPVLPPIAASTCPTSVVGTAAHRTPRRYVAAAKPATSVVHPPPKATTVPSRSRRSSLQRRATTAVCFACSPAGSSCVVCSRAPSASCARGP